MNANIEHSQAGAAIGGGCNQARSKDARSTDRYADPERNASATANRLQ